MKQLLLIDKRVESRRRTKKEDRAREYVEEPGFLRGFR